MSRKNIREDSNSKSEEYEYSVEKVLNKRIRRGRTEYFLKWKDYAEDENTWEPVQNLNCAKLIAEFEKKNKNHQERKRKGSLSRVTTRSTVTSGPTQLIAVVKKGKEKDNETIRMRLRSRNRPLLVKQEPQQASSKKKGNVKNKIIPKRRQKKSLGEKFAHLVVSTTEDWKKEFYKFKRSLRLRSKLIPVVLPPTGEAVAADQKSLTSIVNIPPPPKAAKEPKAAKLAACQSSQAGGPGGAVGKKKKKKEPLSDKKPATVVTTTAASAPIPPSAPRYVSEIHAKIKGWTLNKGYGETVLHRAARLGVDVSYFNISIVLNRYKYVYLL